MTELEFMTACSAAMIDAAIALENDNIIEALRERDDQRIRELLLSEF